MGHAFINYQSEVKWNFIEGGIVLKLNSDSVCDLEILVVIEQPLDLFQIFNWIGLAKECHNSIETINQF